MIERRRLIAGAAGVAWLQLANASPDPPSGVEARVRRLPMGHSLALGPASVVGEFNATARRFGLHRTGPRARDFSRRMVWAPQRRRALFAGANHGSPHRLNDVWEFDLAALSWRLLYAPDLPRGYGHLGPDASDVVYVDGELQTVRGGPAVIGHAWSGLTWDPARQRLLFMNVWPVDVNAMVARLGHDPATREASPPLWAFDPAQGRWSRLRTAPPWPKAAVGALLQHVPELGGPVWHLNNWQMRATWLLHGDTLTWERIQDPRQQADFPQQAPGRELVGYHDPARGLVVTQQAHSTSHFDIRDRRWTRFDLVGAPRGHDATGTFLRDPTTGGGLLVDLNQGLLWQYDPDVPAWRPLRPQGPPMPAGRHALAFADESAGVVVVIDGTETWVCRPPARS